MDEDVPGWAVKDGTGRWVWESRDGSMCTEWTDSSGTVRRTVYPGDQPGLWPPGVEFPTPPECEGWGAARMNTRDEVVVVVGVPREVARRMRGSDPAGQHEAVRQVGEIVTEALEYVDEEGLL